MADVAVGDVSLVAFPLIDAAAAFTQTTRMLVRPAHILARDQDDFIVAFITPSPYRSDWVVEMTVSDPEFAVTGLTGDSRILLTKIATLHRVLVQRRLGRIGPETQSKVHESSQQLFSY